MRKAGSESKGHKVGSETKAKEWGWPVPVGLDSRNLWTLSPMDVVGWIPHLLSGVWQWPVVGVMKTLEMPVVIHYAVDHCHLFTHWPLSPVTHWLTVVTCDPLTVVTCAPSPFFIVSHWQIAATQKDFIECKVWVCTVSHVHCVLTGMRIWTGSEMCDHLGAWELNASRGDTECDITCNGSWAFISLAKPFFLWPCNLLWQPYTVVWTSI